MIIIQREISHVIIILFYLIPADFSIWKTLFTIIICVGVPKHFAILLQHQFALVGQGKRTCLAAASMRVCVPSGFVFVVVHDQVAVFLHAQTGRIWVVSVWRPLWIPAIDDKVAIVLLWRTSFQEIISTVLICTLDVNCFNSSLTHLENHLPIPIFGHQTVSFAELLTFGHDLPAHDSVEKKNNLTFITRWPHFLHTLATKSSVASSLQGFLSISGHILDPDVHFCCSM